MGKSLLRVWSEFDTEQVRKHLLVVGELSASCESCQQIGIDFGKARTCPGCKTEFRFVCMRHRSNKLEELAGLGRLKAKRPDLVMIEYDDIKRAAGKSKAHDIFGK